MIADGQDTATLSSPKCVERVGVAVWHSPRR